MIYNLLLLWCRIRTEEYRNYFLQYCSKCSGLVNIPAGKLKILNLISVVVHVLQSFIMNIVTLMGSYLNYLHCSALWPAFLLHSPPIHPSCQKQLLLLSLWPYHSIFKYCIFTAFPWLFKHLILTFMVPHSLPQPIVLLSSSFSFSHSLYSVLAPIL